MTASLPVLSAMLERRISGEPADWLGGACSEIAAGASDVRFANLISLASRYAPRRSLAPEANELDAATQALAGWNPERWTLLEAFRVVLVLSRPDLAQESGAAALEEAFRYADEGELCALYRSLAHWPEAERFAWRAGEGCRTNIVPVFEAVACDTPYPSQHFDDLAWRQLAIKAVFIEAPLWRVYGLDERLSPELARMALDLVEERRSAGRAVPPQLWLCLGEHAGERGRAALEVELRESSSVARRAAVLALARAGERGPARGLARLRERRRRPDDSHRRIGRRTRPNHLPSPRRAECLTRCDSSIRTST